MLPLLPLFVAAASSMTIKPTLRTANGILHVDPKKHVKLNNLIEEPLIISLSRLSLKPLLTEMRADTGIISKWPHGVADALDCGSSLSRVCLVSIARCLSVWKAPCEGGESICLPGQRYTGSRRSCSFCRYRAMTTPVTELARSVIEEREVLIVFNSIILNPCVTIFPKLRVRDRVAGPNFCRALPKDTNSRSTLRPGLLHLSAPRTRLRCGPPRVQNPEYLTFGFFAFSLIHFVSPSPSGSRGARASEAPINPLVGLATSCHRPPNHKVDDITKVASRTSLSSTATLSTTAIA